ncbi:hypothetical protein VTI28DRAFT_2917 [Corynascus sepedonium]
MAPLPPPLPEGGLTFTYEPSVAALNISVKSFVAARPLIANAAASAIVFSRATGEDRVLLIQRAPHDSMPLLWEVPGGACDPEDETILHAVGRELWEEAGLKLKRVVRQVGPELALLGKRLWSKVTCEVEVEVEGGDSETTLPKVTLDPNEHVRFLWATEDECRSGKVAVLRSDGEKEIVDIRFTSKDQKAVILLGFKLRKQDGQHSMDKTEGTQSEEKLS